MVVQHNLRAMNSNRMLGLTTASQSKSTEKLSSGYKINRAADDAAGLAISEKMRKQVRGLTQASANAQDGISAVQTAEGALTEVHDMLQRMNELAVKASNGTMSEGDRSYVQQEIDQLVTEIDRVAETTKFNETYLLKGSGDKSATVKAEATIGTTTSEASVKAATGNRYSADISTTLADGTEDTATIQYLDADGKTRTQDVTFKVGNDSKSTAASLAKAIENDSVLSKIFNASADDSGKITIESKLNGNKTDSTRNAVDKTNGITFSSAAGTRKTSAANVDTKDATGESVEFTLGSGANNAGFAMALADGNGITIDGKTYTYDASGASSDANSFKTLDDLKKLLGDDYEVSVTYSMDYTETTYGATNSAITKTQNKTQEMTVTAESATALSSLAKTGIATTTSGTWKTTAAAAANSTVVSALGAEKLTLNVARKATNEISDAMKLSLHVGAESGEENKISLAIESMNAKGLGIDGLKVDGANSKNADNAIDTIAAAIKKVSTQRSDLGAIQNRLEHTINNLDNVVENTTSAESAIRDTDMATEMVKFANNNILAQAGQSMLAQANQSNQGVLSLLG